MSRKEKMNKEQAQKEERKPAEQETDRNRHVRCPLKGKGRRGHYESTVLGFEER